MAADFRRQLLSISGGAVARWRVVLNKVLSVLLGAGAIYHYMLTLHPVGGAVRLTARATTASSLVCFSGKQREAPGVSEDNSAHCLSSDWISVIRSYSFASCAISAAVNIRLQTKTHFLILLLHNKSLAV